VGRERVVLGTRGETLATADTGGFLLIVANPTLDRLEGFAPIFDHTYDVPRKLCSCEAVHVSRA
jgi:hypothetical protein